MYINAFHTVTSNKKRLYILEQNSGGMCYYSSGGRNLLFLTDIPLHHKPCYKILLTSLNNFVLIVRIAIKLVFPDRIYNVF